MGWVVNATPRPLYLLVTQCIQGGLDEWENLAPTGIRPRTVQHLASPYTEWAIAAHTDIYGHNHNVSPTYHIS
jgi:hypothetical protein